MTILIDVVVGVRGEHLAGVRSLHASPPFQWRQGRGGEQDVLGQRLLVVDVGRLLHLLHLLLPFLWLVIGAIMLILIIFFLIFLDILDVCE